MQIPASNPLASLLGTQKTQAPSVAASFFAPEPTTVSGPRAEFQKRAQMTFAEQMREQVLSALGVDEEDLKSMSAEEREAIEAKIRDAIKAKVEEAQEEKTGVFVDISV